MNIRDTHETSAPGRLALYVLPALLAVFACNGDLPADEHHETSGDGDGDGEPKELRSEAPHDDSPQLESGEQQTLTAANHALTLDLYHALRDGEAAGLGFSISAYSIESAFGMLYAGSVDPARGQIAQTLHFDLQGDQQHVAHNWLDDQLDARNLAGDDESDPVELQTANHVWLLDDFASGIGSEFLDRLSIHYDAGVRLAAFDVDPEFVRDEINGWVDDKTGGLIPQLFGENSITEYTTMVLVNALYLRAPWSEPFSTSATQQREFTQLDSQVVLVDMMRASALMSARYGGTADYQAASLPLRGGQLDIVVILPTNFAAFEAGLDVATLDAVLASLAPTPLDLSMPKLELKAAFELSSELQELGMVAPFADTTSFDAIHPDTDNIEIVVQNTVIKLDEDGVEAAAATGIGGDGDGDPMQPEVMVVDRPYMIAIRDRPTGILLFFGRVLDPSI